MKRIIIIVLINLFLISFAQSQTIKINTSANGINIKIDSLSIEKSNTPNETKFTLNNIKDKYLTSYYDNKLEEIRLLIALPSAKVDDFQYKINSFKNINNFDDLGLGKSYKPNIKLKHIGYLKGIPVTELIIRPFEYNAGTRLLSIINNAEINLKFKQKLSLSDFNNNEIDSPLYSNIINKNQLNSIKKLISKSKKYQNFIQDDENWYNPDMDYLQIKTTKDGIALVKARDLIKLMPDYKGKNRKYFHLLFKGQEQPLAFLNSDSLLDNQQEIIFEGHRAAGDTTWLNFYTDFAPFFFYYDDSHLGLRFQTFEQPGNVSDTINTVLYSRHFEKETDYFRGDFAYQYDVENIYREKWLWKLFSSYRNNYFDFDFFYLPSFNQSDSLTIRVNYESIVWNKELINKHNLNFIFNNSLYHNVKVDTGKIFDFVYSLPSQSIASGINQIRIENIGQKDGNNHIIQPDDIGIDFIEVEGKSKPFATNGKAVFKIPELNQKSKLIVNGFSNKDILLLDKKNNLFSEIQGEKNLSISAAVKTNNPYSSIVINDSIYTDTIPGFHISAVYPPNYNQYYFKNFLSYSGVVSFLNSVPSGSVLTITNNIKMKIPDEIITKLKDLGSIDISSIAENQAWVFSVLVGQSIKFESASKNNTASIYGSYPVDSEEHYLIEQNLSENRSYDLMIFDKNSIELAQIQKVNKTDLKNDTNHTDAIFIAYKDFVSGADRLAEFRRDYQNINVKVIDVDDIYKEFNYGVKSPHAIKKFLKYAQTNWVAPTPSYLLLIGDADWDARNKLSGSVNIDYVPSYGWPVSDYWYSLLDTGIDYVHDMFVGRLPVKNTNELSAVINKLIEYDTIPPQPWMKTFLTLTGGSTESERQGFKESMQALVFSGWMTSEIGGDTMMVAKKDPTIAGELEANEIISKIDKGAVWVNFYGHGSPQVLDMDGWHPQYLNNRFKYSFFTTISCNTAAFAEPQGTARNEDYLLIPERGFIGDGGSSNLGLELPGLQLVTKMLEILSDTSKIERSFGEIVNNAKTPLFSSEPLYIAYLMQYTLLADPLTKIRIAPKPLFFIMEKDVEITNYADHSIILSSDKYAKLKGIFYNNGPCSHGITNLILYHKYANTQDTLTLSFQDICRSRNFIFDSLMIENKLGNNNVKIYYSDSYGNKRLLYNEDFKVFQDGVLALEPMSYWNMNYQNPRFRVLNPMAHNENILYDFIIKENLFNGNENVIYQSKPDEITTKENYIDWQPNIKLNTNKTYVFYGRDIDTSQKESQWLRIPFYTSDEDIVKSTKVKFNKMNFNDCSLTNLRIDTTDNSTKISFSQSIKKFNIEAARGVKGSKDTARYAEIKVDSTFYIVTPHVDNAPVGINIVVLSGTDGHYLYSKQYYTYAGENANVDVVNYLNDSVKVGDYLLLAACGSAWRLFYHTSIKDSNAIGSFNSLKKALSDYGADLIYQLPDTSDVLYVSYAFAGRKGMDKIAEDINFIGYRIYLSGTLSFDANQGRLETPLMGYAKKWDKLILTGDLNFTDMAVKTFIYGTDAQKNDSLLIEENNKSSIDISGIDTKIFPNIKIVLEFNKLNKNANFALNEINVDLLPASELAISKINSSFSNDSIIRGDQQKVNSIIENLSLRSKSKNAKALIQVLTNAGQNYDYNLNIGELDINSSQSFSQQINTDNLASDNVVDINLNADNSIIEQYKFNNNANINLHILRDEVKPWISIKFDGIEIQDSAYVSLKPKIDVRIFDNSKLKFTTNTITFRINFLKQSELNTESYKFELLNQDSLKAILSFIPDSFENVQNNIEVNYSDIEGNKSTENYTVFTSINSFILNLTNRPNPFSDETDIVFRFKSPDNKGDMTLKIYDLNGNNVRTIKPQFNVGENIIHWNGKDNFGNSLPNGVYFYMINIVNGDYIDPKSGKCIKIK